MSLNISYWSNKHTEGYIQYYASGKPASSLNEKEKRSAAKVCCICKYVLNLILEMSVLSLLLGPPRSID